ncbi:MAG: flagellar protein FliS [Gammaproteobacteria bacterium]|nr:flagellar protein FliS [Gammaproteobacteria bacterium]
MPATLTFRASHGSRLGQGGPAVGPYGIARLLMDGALERIEAARERLLDGDAAGQSQLRSAVMIITELRADLDLPRGGAIAANLDDLYDYMCRRLGAADLQNGIAALDEVSHLLDALQSAWNYMPVEVRVASRN